MRAVPSDGPMRPASMRTEVVLPAPFGPSRPKISPSPTVNERSLTAVRDLKCFVSPTASIIAPHASRTPPHAPIRTFGLPGSMAPWTSEP